jgi:peptidoglycan/xylan/chitin deacetylase (PgdA/CDA1 family)
MWNDSVIEVLRNCSDKVLDLRELGLDCYTVETIALRRAAADSILRAIKHLDPDGRQALVNELEKHGSKLPDDLMLSDAQVQSLAVNNVAIGAHTVNHPILSSVSGEIAHSEIRDSKLYLEELLQRQIEVFAYPNGRPNLDYRSAHREMVRELGFKAAVSTHWGVSTAQSDRFQLPRFTPWDRRPLKFGIRLLAGYRRVDPLIASGF